MKYKNILTLLGIIALWCATHGTLNAQILYATVYDPATGQPQLFKLNVATCEMCPISSSWSPPPPVMLQGVNLVVLPNGNILTTSASFEGTYLFDPPNATPIASFPSQYFYGAVLAPSGLVYLSGALGNLGLSSFNPANNTFSFIGPWPANIEVTEMFYWNGLLYAVGRDVVNGQGVLLQVNLTNPALSTIVQNPTLLNEGLQIASIVSGAGQGIYCVFLAGSPSVQYLVLYDIATNTLGAPICDLSAYDAILGLSALPAGVTPEPCLGGCITNAGSVSNSAVNLCVPLAATVPYNNNAVLDGNDILRYILYTNPNNLPGSIVATSTTPNIPFNPATMQPNVTYYLGTIAGNNVSGNIDLTDPCLDFSNADATVTWRPRPTVTFSAANLNVCGGDCRTITANFTGTPPFALIYTTPTGAFTQTFAGNTGTIQVCAPVGAPAGPLQVQATNLVDIWCGCP